MVLDINDKSGEALLQGDTVPHRSVVSNKSERLLHAIHDPEVEEAPSECLVGPSTAVRQAIFDLFDGRVTFHKAAIDKLVDQFDLEELRDINLQEEIDKIEAHNFYSSHGDLKALLGNDKEKAERERYREGLRQLISRIWRREGRVFLKVPAFGNVKGGFSSYMGVRCARILRPDDAEEIQDRASICQRLIKYQILFLLATHEAIAKKDGHRRAYFWAQMGALTVNELREKHSSEGEDAVVLAMKDKSDDQVRAYLDAMLSLIFPDKANMKMNDVGQMLIFDLFQEAEWRLKKGDNTLHDFVQEHFITSQLITLARARGLWAEYGCYLEKLLQARKDQFINNFHLRPIGPKEGERHTERKISLLELIANYYYNNDERLPSMASLGCGDCQLELFLSRLGFIEGPFKGVDLFDDENEDELYLEMPYEKNEVYRFNNKYRGEEGFADEVLKKMGSADLIFAGDVVHETEDPSRYFLGAYDAVNPGGYMVVSDPIHCSAVDQVTSVSVNRFDSTE